MEALEERVVLSAFTVTTVADSGPGSLRQAILDANANPGFDEVRFNIPGAGVHTIAPLTLLPSTLGGGPIAIDATSQPGFDHAGPRLIELSGANIPNGSGLLIQSSDSLIRGLAINGFYNGIRVHGVSNVRIESNYLGLDSDGTSIAVPWIYQTVQENGLVLSATNNATVGGTTAETRNVISGNRVGIFLHNNATASHIIGNYIGTEVTGVQSLANQTGIHLFGQNTGNHIGEPGHGNLIVEGVLVHGASDNVFQANSIGGIELSGAGATRNLIGGTTIETRNMLGGVEIFGAHSNAVQGNYIGVDPTGTQRTSTGNVLVWNGAHDNVIGTDGDGTDDAAEGNVIGGGVGIAFGWQNGSDTINNVVAGNVIGTDATGMVALGQHPHPDYRIGVQVETSFNRIGTNGDGVSDDLERNVISGGWNVGVRVTGPDAQFNVIAGNYIGTDITGTAALPNRGGVSLEGENNRLGTDGNGTSDALEGNLISGNTVSGVHVGDRQLVAGNRIGTDVTGHLPLGNGIGIDLRGTGSTIGGATPALRNIISGNSQSGIDTNNAREFTILGNYIGVDKAGTGPLGNGADGVWLRFNSFNNTIGGTTPGAANVIANNGRNGVSVSEGLRQFFGLETASGNSLRGNSIYANAGLGIDLGQYYGQSPPPSILHNETPVIIPGVTPNDAGDSDSGPNGFQNFPELIAAASAATTRVQGSLHSTPNSTFTLDFYANSTADPSGYGEGERWLGSATVSTDASGNATFDVTVTGPSLGGELITATATDAGGNTSEFSAGVISINAVIPVTVEVVGGTFTYDGLPHGATSSSVTATDGFSAVPTLTYYAGTDISGTGSPDAPVNAGTYTVVASFAGNDGHYPGSASALITIDKADVMVEVSGGTFTYDGSAHGATSNSVTGPGGLSTTAELSYYSGATLLPGAPTNAGSYTVVASYGGDANHNAGSASASLTILAKDLTATGSTQSSINISKAGTLTFTLSNVSGIVAGDGTVSDLFNGATFQLSVNGTLYSVNSTATVLTDGTIQISWRMTQELYQDLYAALGSATPSNKTLVDFFVSGTSNDGNYLLTADVFSRIFQQGKVLFS